MLKISNVNAPQKRIKNDGLASNALVASLTGTKMESKRNYNVWGKNLRAQK